MNPPHRYFQSVIRNNSFSEAAEECHISQSAISQQVQALERELGFDLLERKNRKFSLTPAGEHFYKKSLVLIADYERMCQEARRLAIADQATLTIGYLRCYSGQEFHLALGEFSAKYPDAAVKIEYGNHEELYGLLQTGGVDIVLNDQRRAFSDQYVNLILTVGSEYIEISSHNPIASLPSVTPQDLKNVPCILVSSKEQQENEQEYYQGVVGFQGEFLYAENLEEAHSLHFLTLLNELTEEKQATSAQISLVWMLCKKPFIILIHRSHKPGRLKDNFGATDIILTTEKIAAIDKRPDTMTIPVFGGH